MEPVVVTTDGITLAGVTSTVVDATGHDADAITIDAAHNGRVTGAPAPPSGARAVRTRPHAA